MWYILILQYVVAGDKMRNWLRNIRGDRTQAEVADICDMSQQFYSAIETGLRTPKPKVAQRMGAGLGFDWTIFYKEADRDAS
jgi:transcriptional regulator with XRE-family HTH domain